jgi:hypothetical protein
MLHLIFRHQNREQKPLFMLAWLLLWKAVVVLTSATVGKQQSAQRQMTRKFRTICGALCCP